MVQIQVKENSNMSLSLCGNGTFHLNWEDKTENRNAPRSRITDLESQTHLTNPAPKIQDGPSVHQ